MIHVFGHLSPDTDATGSAIIWTWYLGAHTGQAATPYVLGELNSETKFVLNHFSVPTPELLPELPAGSEVVVVDTNNPQELPANIGEMTITGLIDHHKLVGGLTTELPSTITIVDTINISRNSHVMKLYIHAICRSRDCWTAKRYV